MDDEKTDFGMTKSEAYWAGGLLLFSGLFFLSIHLLRKKGICF